MLNRNKPTSSSNYEDLYNSIAKKFWDLCEIELTDQEKEYHENLKKFEALTYQFTEEINSAEERNKLLKEELVKYDDEFNLYKSKLKELEILYQIRNAK